MFAGSESIDGSVVVESSAKQVDATCTWHWDVNKNLVLGEWEFVSIGDKEKNESRK